MTLVLLSLIIAFVLTVWFETNALYEYAVLFNWVNKIQLLRDYDMYRDSDGNSNLQQYLADTHDFFLVRLVTCPTCFATWLGILSIPISGWAFFAVAFSGLFLYNCNRAIIR